MSGTTSEQALTKVKDEVTMFCFNIGPFEFKVEGRSKTAGTAEGCDFWDQNGVLLLHLRVQQQRKSKINEFTMSDGIE